MPRTLLAATCLLAVAAPASAQTAAPPPPDMAAQPWRDRTRPPDERAALVLAQMTLDEKIQLLHGQRGYRPGTAAGNGGAGFVPGIARLGIPDLNLADSTVGIARGAARGRYATLMPAAIAEASAWSPKLSYDYGALIGRELRAQGYNVSLAGGANLMREPRNGRTFEYRGEDPLLTGKLTAQAIRGLQDQKVIGDLKHYAFNDQETGRNVGNVLIDYRAARESDLLAFEIAAKEGEPGMVMCAYNKVWGDWACENDELLRRTLKGEWGFKGWVLSDWGGTHSTAKAIDAGLDQEQPGNSYFGDALKAAVIDGSVAPARVDDAVRRILRTIFAHGLFDSPPQQQVVDLYAGFDLSQRVAEAGSVLLKNDGALPLVRRAGVTVAVIGSHADVGVLTGGGSGQVDPPGGNAVKGAQGVDDQGPAGIFSRVPVWYPSSPLKALQAAAPGMTFVWDDGADPVRAAALAAKSDAAIVFAHQPSTESRDATTLALPFDQDRLIDAVTAARPGAIVVLETGGPVTMPWLDRAGAVAEVWYPGARGGEAIARLLLGDANFRGKLPITFPRSTADLPHPEVPGSTLKEVPVPPGTPFATMANGRPRMTLPPFDIDYRREGARVGYKWFDARGAAPLFAFGHGLSYTRFAYAAARASVDGVSFTVTNTGDRPGTEIAQVYAALPAKLRQAPRQLVGWQEVELAPGESRTVTVRYEPLAISAFDVGTRTWRRPKGDYDVFVGGSSRDTPLKVRFAIR